jgi:ABC-type Fe3+/spermidine/putrescine transport system ATPase subunit
VKEEKPVEVNRKFDSYIQLRDINLKIKKGEFVCIIGDTSSGKTTLLRTLSGETAFVSQEIIKKYT